MERPGGSWIRPASIFPLPHPARQHDDEPGTLSIRLDGDRAMVALDDLAGDGQAETGAAGVTAAGAVEPGEALEDPLPIAGGHARAVIGDHQPGVIVVARERDPDGRATMARRVLEQVADHSRQLVASPRTSTGVTWETSIASGLGAGIRRTSSRTRSSRSTSDVGVGEAPASVRARKSRSWTSRDIRWLSSTSAARRLRPVRRVGLGECHLEVRQAGSQRALELVRRVGHEARADARPTSRAGRACRSSCEPGGRSRRRPPARARGESRSCSPISATSRRMASTGRRARPTTYHVVPPTKRQQDGQPDEQDAPDRGGRCRRTWSRLAAT